MDGHFRKQSGGRPDLKREAEVCRPLTQHHRRWSPRLSTRLTASPPSPPILLALSLCLLLITFSALHGTICSAETGKSAQPVQEKRLKEVPRLIERIAEADTSVNNKSANSPTDGEALRQSVERTLKRAISRQPADVRVLDPVFAAATGGTPSQRKAAIEILGSLKEPLAEPLLVRIAGESDNPLNETAAQGLSRIRSTAITTSQSRLTRYFQIVLMVGSILIACGLITAGIWKLRTNGNFGQGALLLLCGVLTVWFFGIIASDYFVSGVTAQEVDETIREKHLFALAKKINFEWSGYPGDSYVARYLVSKGDPGIIPLLTQVKTETPASIRYQDYWNKRLERRIDWTIARLKEMEKKSAGSQGSAKD